MAYLIDTRAKRRQPLRAHHTIGRSADKADTVVADPAVSRIHAVLEWEHPGWRLRDLSRNGTWLDGRRLAAGEGTPVRAGARLNLGGRNGPALVLEDAGEPCSMLLGDAEGCDDLLLAPYLFLPDETSPKLVVYYSPQRREWLYYPLGSGHEPLPGEPLAHGQALAVEDLRWRVFLAETGRATAISGADQRLGDFEFLFDLSLDEECTRLRLRQGRHEIDLGERSHHYLLLQLARHRCDEARHGIDPGSQGWVDNELLAKELGVDLSHLNILIFRARKQLAEKLAGAVDSEPLVERRKGQVRFGCPRFTIHKGESLTHAMSGPAASP